MRRGLRFRRQGYVSRSLDCLRPLGMFVSFGQSSGPIPPFNLALLSQKGSLYADAPTLFAYIAKRDALVAGAKTLFDVVGGACPVDGQPALCPEGCGRPIPTSKPARPLGRRFYSLKFRRYIAEILENLSSRLVPLCVRQRRAYHDREQKERIGGRCGDNPATNGSTACWRSAAYEDLRHAQGLRQYRSKDRTRRDSRAPRRERRRQVHARQDDVRLACSPIPARSAGRESPLRISSPAAPELGHRHGVPAFLAVRGADGRREHRPRWMTKPPTRHDRRQGPGAVLELRPAARSLRAWSATFRSANASVSRSSAACSRTPRAHHPGRADLGADAAGGRPAVRHPGAAARRGQVASSTSPTGWRR